MNEIDAATQLEPQANAPGNHVTTLATGATVALAGRMIGRGLHVVGQVLLARFLGPEAFGLYAIGWTLLRVVGLLAPLGLDNGVIRFAAPHWRKDQAALQSVLYQSFSLALLSGFCVSASFYLAAPWLGGTLFQKPDLVPVLRYLAWAFWPLAGLRVFAAATTLSQSMRYAVQAEEVAQPLINLLLIITFYFLGWGLLGATAAAVISFSVALLLAVYYLARLFPFRVRPQFGPRSTVKELLSFSMPASLSFVLGVYILWVDRLMVGYFLPEAEVGIYQAASQSSLLFATILGAMNAIFSPMIAELIHQKEKQQLEELFRVSTKWGLYLSVPLFLTLCFVPREVMTVVFGLQYEGGYMLLVILAVAQLVNVGTGAVNILLIMAGYQKRWLVTSTVMLAVNIGLNALLIPQVGLVGAAVATAATVCGLFVAGLLQVRHLLKIWPYDGRYLKGFLATLLTALALWGLQSANVASPALALTLALVISGFVFSLTLLVTGLDSEDRHFISLVLMRSGLVKSEK